MINGNAIGEIILNAQPQADAAAVKKTAEPADMPPSEGRAEANKKTPTPGEIERISSELDGLLRKLNTELRLEVDDRSGRVIVKVIDAETSKVIKQIPSEEMVRIGRKVAELIERYSEETDKGVNLFLTQR